MTIDPDKDVKSSANAASRTESSALEDTPLKSLELDACSRPGATPAATEENRRSNEKREEEMVAFAGAQILICGDFLLVKDLANHLGMNIELLSLH